MKNRPKGYKVPEKSHQTKYGGKLTVNELIQAIGKGTKLDYNQQTVAKIVEF